MVHPNPQNPTAPDVADVYRALLLLILKNHAKRSAHGGRQDQQ